MAAIVKGTTVSFEAVLNFHELSHEDAEAVIYDRLVPACEAKGVRLMQGGNINWNLEKYSVEEYNQQKEEHKLFNVERIQKAFSELQDLIQTVTQFKEHSYGLKHHVERAQDNEYLSNGALIVAMLLKGYAARFGKQNARMELNAEFRVKRITKQDREETQLKEFLRERKRRRRGSFSGTLPTS